MTERTCHRTVVVGRTNTARKLMWSATAQICGSVMFDQKSIKKKKVINGLVSDVTI